MSQDAFPADYFAARERFRELAHAAGAQCSAYAIAARGPEEQPLSVDVAVLGSATAGATLVISSGLHGVEGFAGSAVQCALLASLAPPSSQCLPPNMRVALVHALNPYGFAWRRRVNEHNVDLNRNFLPEGESYAGAPPEVCEMASFIAPDSPPDPSWLAWRFWPQAALQLARHGAATLRGALSQAQYEYPQGLFYGGSGPEESTLLVRRHYAEWTGSAAFVLHLDLHTGLGQRGHCVLFAGRSKEEAHWLERHFAGQDLHSADAGYGNRLRGDISDELPALVAGPGRRLLYITAEFGTCSSVVGFRALREENRAARFGGPYAAAARRQLMHCFCPDDPQWRREVLRRGRLLVEQGLAACAFPI